jgi:DNA polymerase-3 subunit epsilon
MRDYLLFVDTETSGIPPSMKAAITDTGRWPFVLQVAWRVYERSGRLLKSENHFIFEPDISIEKAAIKVHGITKEALRKKGEDRKAVMRLLTDDLTQYKPLIIGHFVEFDSKMLQVALQRSGLPNVLKDLPHFCTMRSTTEYTRFPNHHYPQLPDLYQGLFGEKMRQVHDSAADAEATARCFFELYSKGELDEQMIDNQPLFEKVKEKVRQNTGCAFPLILLLMVGLLMTLL